MIGKQIYTVEQLAQAARDRRSVTGKNGRWHSWRHLPAAVVLRMQASVVLNVIEGGLFYYEPGQSTSVFGGQNHD
jgi:hypothetical protein